MNEYGTFRSLDFKKMLKRSEAVLEMSKFVLLLSGKVTSDLFPQL